MGNTAENVAKEYQITRAEQDALRLASQQKASAAQKSGRFKGEIVPVTVKTRKGDTVVADDEYIRHDATADGMARLRPAFAKDGTVTAGNASRHQRRRGRPDGDECQRSKQARPDAAGAHRRVRYRRRRSGADGHRPNPVDPQGAEARRLERPRTST